MASKLYVGGLSYSTTSETLREYFAQCGTVESASVITDKFGAVEGVRVRRDVQCRGGAASDRDLNGKDLDGRKLTVNLSNPRPAGGARRRRARPAGRASRRRPRRRRPRRLRRAAVKKPFRW